MKVSGQHHTLAALPLGKSPWYPLDRRLGEHQDPEVTEKREILFCKESNPGRQAHSSSLYRLNYPNWSGYSSSFYLRVYGSNFCVYFHILSNSLFDNQFTFTILKYKLTHSLMELSP
jgi:hypothetical protein